LMKLVFCTFWAAANWWNLLSAAFELQPIGQVTLQPTAFVP
jgi:hypothetical protein